MTEITKLSSRGQLVLPISIRNKLNLKEGDTIAIDVINNMIIMKEVELDLETQFKRSLDDLKKGRIRKVA